MPKQKPAPKIIKVSKTTRTKLKSLKMGGESYDQLIIRRLLSKKKNGK